MIHTGEWYRQRSEDNQDCKNCSWQTWLNQCTRCCNPDSPENGHETDGCWSCEHWQDRK